MNIKRVTQREMEQYILGELSDARLREIENHLKENSKLRKEIDRIKNSNKMILNRYPAKKITEKIFAGLSREMNKEKKEIKNRPVFIRKLLYVSPLLVLTILVIFTNIDFFKGKTDRPDKNSFEQTTRSKGLNHAYLIVYKLAQGKIEQLKNRGRANPGDTLQLIYSSPKESHGVIFSIDGRGGVTLHFPNNPLLSTALQKSKKVKLTTGFLLDDAPDFERFFFLTSNSEINVARILEKARNRAKNLSLIKQGNLKIDKHLKQYSIIIKKGEML
jgi:hypothetical protein